MASFQRGTAAFGLAVLIGFAFATTGFAAEHARIGVVRSTLSAPIYIAVDKGFFAAEGIDPELVFFDAGQPIFVATVSGDLDFGVTGVTGGFYQLAAQGEA